MEFRILGALEVSDEGRLVEVRPTKLRVLLAMLLLHPNEVVSSDRLVETLWGQAPPASAVNTLQGYVSHLRKALGPQSGQGDEPLLRTASPGYVLSVDRSLVDAWRFEHWVAEGRRQLTGSQPEKAARTLADALALWRGPALVEFAYDEFARDAITRLEELRMGASEDLMEARLALGHHAEVLGELTAMTGSAPLRERRWALLMLALYRTGRQADALRAYQQLHTTLADQLGIEPSAELRRLENAILLQDPDLDWHAPALAAPGAARERFPMPELIASDTFSAFVGRHDEADLLRDRWTRAEAGERQVAVLSGEAGIGKSRLAAELAREANARRAIVLYGRCDEELLVPHQPFMEALGHYVAKAPPGEVHNRLESAAPELGRVLPELAHQLPVPPAADPETERYRLFEAVTGFLSGIATGAPVLLILDDLHWADKSTLLLLRHLLLRGPLDLRLLVLAIHRDDHTPDNDVLADVFADAGRRCAVDHITLDGLGDDDVVGVLQASGLLKHEEEQTAVARVIRRETGGNPLFVGEIVRHLQESGALQELMETSGPSATGPAGEGREEPPVTDIVNTIGVPEGLRRVVRRRVARLSEPARSILAVASVVGPQFDLDVMEQASGLREDEVLDAVEEVMSARLVIEMPATESRYSFCHAVVRGSIYSSLTRGRRRRLHLQVAQALENLLGSAPTARLALLAYHLDCAGPAADPAKAIHFARRAAADALSRAAYEQAALHYRSALAAVDRLPTVDLQLRIELLLSLGETQNRAGELVEAKEVFRQAAAVARQLDAPAYLARVALGYGGTVRVAPIEDPESVELIREALAAIGDRDGPYRALLLSRLAQWLYRSAPHEERASLCATALGIARRLDDPKVLASVLNDQSWALYGPEDLEGRIAAGKEILDLGVQLGSEELQLQGSQSLVHGYLELGDIPSSTKAMETRDRLAHELRQPQYLWNVAVSRASEAIVEGRFAEADVLVERALATRYRADPRQASNVYLAQKFVLHWLQGRLAEQGRALSELVKQYPGEILRCTSRAWFLAEVGEHGAARADLESLDPDTLAGMPMDIDFYPVVVGATVTSIRLRDPRLASTLYELLLPFEGRNCMVAQSAFLGAASHYLGLLARLLDRPDVAAAHLEVALARHIEMGARPFEALTRHALAESLRLLDAPGQAARAEELARAALAAAADLGLGVLLDDASGRAASLVGRTA